MARTNLKEKVLSNQKRNDEMQTVITGRWKTQYSSIEPIMSILNCSKSHAYELMKNPDRLSIKQYRELCKYLSVPLEEARSAAIDY